MSAHRDKAEGAILDATDSSAMLGPAKNRSAFIAIAYAILDLADAVRSLKGEEHESPNTRQG